MWQILERDVHLYGIYFFVCISLCRWFHSKQ